MTRLKKLKNLFQRHTISGETITVDEFRITPQSQVMMVRWPYGGLIWNLPQAILVERGEQMERIRIIDVTRIAKFGLLGLSLIFSIIIFILSRKEQ